MAEYDPALRKSRGVWYTPEPVVGFIVRAVDEVLRKDFALEMGIADSSKISIKTKVAVKGKTKNSRTTLKDYEREVHKVQLLDPACGTGTFLAETIKQIYKEFDSIPGAWPAYVDEHLIPRLHGFELLMASYAMAHLKVDLLLRETGYKSRSDDQRLRIFLTNALEEHHPDTGTLFATWLSNEAQEANYVKRDTPVMVVIGNPPYSGVSSNMSPWINELIEDYKYVDGEHFREKKHWLHDDYVKFIRNAQFYIEKNGEGILAFINNHAFLNNPTFRGMRNNILLAFDKIYILNLHGNLNDGDLHGANDENVFDIKKGVSINIFVKNGGKKGRLADVYYADLTGSRESKYNFLFDNSLSTVKFDKLEVEAPYYFLSPVKAEKGISYDGWPSIADIFPIGTMGYASAQDKLTVSFEKHSLRETVDYFVNHTEAEIKSRFQIKKESRDWTVASAKRDLQINNDDNFIIKTAYRPFDIRYTYYTGTSRGFYASPQKKVMQHLINKENIAFCCCKINRDYSPTYWLAQQAISKSVISSLDNAYVFPLYLYPDDGSEGERIPNISIRIISEFEKSTGLSISEMEGAGKGTFRPIDLLDYVYAILHCSDYRDKYKEQLKVEYPRIPYPKNANAFFELAQLGAQLRDIHLMSWSSLGKSVVRFPIAGPNTITKKISERSLELTDPSSKAGRIWINDEQYFENIDANIWSHWIGGYQPAVKWLKDREGLTLDLANIQHYQKIILALVRTDEISKEVGIAYQKHF